jgi:hypothetical protein
MMPADSPKAAHWNDREFGTSRRQLSSANLHHFTVCEKGLMGNRLPKMSASWRKLTAPSSAGIFVEETTAAVGKELTSVATLGVCGLNALSGPFDVL